MGCFRCSGESSIKKPEKLRKNNNDDNQYRRADHASPNRDALQVSPCKDAKEESKVLNKRAVEEEVDASKNPSSDGEANSVKARTFTYAELLSAMQNFKAEIFLGEGGFGKV
ncbi:unnamed protein product [Fraxinus pennsylvanica]|uniref:Uncharacterized protein n=1 Tax=Fraxinus pennsylvanica TaxID=56036 RepID=A0AAD1ZIK6_9LAMI|nr:unnamed protein product [Fraxinus pennsylvanica]